MKPIYILLLILSATFSIAATAQKEENHVRMHGSAGIVLNTTLAPAITTGVIYNMNRVYNGFNISLQGDKKRAIFELRSGYILGKPQGPVHIIPFVGVGYEFKTRTPMLHKDADAPSWSDPYNIVLPARVRFTYGFHAITPSPWQKASFFMSYHATTRGTEYIEEYPVEAKVQPLRGNGNGQLHVNKWQKTSTIPSFAQFGILVRVTWSTCD